MTPNIEFEDLILAIQRQRAELSPVRRLLVAIAGAPGSGKSTLAQRLVGRLNENAGRSDQPGEKLAVVIPMDGFHLDNGILESRYLLDRKGAAHTFDVAGFLSLLKRLAQPVAVNPDSRHAKSSSPDNEAANVIYVPLFDRKQDLSRNAAQSVEVKHTILVVEGNYLLLNQPDWSELKSLFDMSVMLEVPFEELERRLIQRWLEHGLSKTAARERALSNDIPNAQLVISDSAAAHFKFHSV